MTPFYAMYIRDPHSPLILNAGEDETADDPAPDPVPGSTNLQPSHKPADGPGSFNINDIPSSLQEA
ncbi:unnamed protein product, partial [Darwinula stevensoni]